MAPLDLPELQRAARRCRRNRRGAVPAPLAVALAGVLIAVPLLRPAGTETLAPAQPAADEPYRVWVTCVAL